MAFLSFMPTVLKNLVSKPATSQYPFVKMDYPDATRGSIYIDVDACIFCGICAKKCPTSVIRVDKSDKSWTIERFGCLACNYCVECCPKKCLKMNQEYTSPSAKKFANCYKIKPVEEEIITDKTEE